MKLRGGFLKGLWGALRIRLSQCFYLAGYLFEYGGWALARRVRDPSFLPSKLTAPAMFLGGVASFVAQPRTFQERRFRRIFSHVDEADIVISFARGGGAGAYVTNAIHQAPASRLIIVAKASIAKNIIDVELWQKGGLCGRAKAYTLSSLKVLPRLHVRKIVVNELVLWHRYLGLRGMTEEGMARLTAEILALQKAWRCETVYLVHDYFAMCPRITLLTAQGVYCGTEFSPEACRRCVALGVGSDVSVLPGCDVRQWREVMRAFFGQIQEVRAFSKDTQRRMMRAFPGIIVTCVPHAPLAKRLRKPTLSSNPIVIGVFGAIGILKGIRPLFDLADFLATVGQIHIVVIGRLEEPYKGNGDIVVHGRYAREELPDLVERYGINVALFPSVWPETFSYVSQEIMQMGMPLVCYNLGAVPERLEHYPYGVVAKDFSPEATWEAISLASKRMQGTT